MMLFAAQKTVDVALPAERCHLNFLLLVNVNDAISLSVAHISAGIDGISFITTDNSVQ